MYRMTTQKQVREAFWNDVEQYPDIYKHVSRKKIPHYSGKGKMWDTDTRCTFNDFVDMLSKDGSISQELAQRLTL